MKSHKRTNTRPGEQSQTKQFRKKKEPNPSSKTQQNAAEQQWISVYLFMSSFCERTPHPPTTHPTAFFCFFLMDRGQMRGRRFAVVCLQRRNSTSVHNENETKV